jgi:hypothetical protein
LHLPTGEAVTALPGEVLTDSVVLTRLADSPAVALVRDSAGCGDFLLVDFLVAEITAALVTVVSVTIVSFFNSLPGLFIGIPTILAIIPIWSTDRITTINMGTIQPRLCNRNPSDPPSTIARLSSSQATPGAWIKAPKLRTSIAATIRPIQQGNKKWSCGIRTRKSDREPIQ